MLLNSFFRYRFSIFIFGLFLLFLTHSLFAEFLSSLVSVFAAATSYHLKTAFFLVYALLCFLIVEHQSVRLDFCAAKSKYLIFPVIAFLAILNIVLYFYFLHVYALPFSVKAKYWFFIAEGIGDVTAFCHSHALKAVWYCLASFFHIKGLFSRIDPQAMDAGGFFTGAGYPFFTIVPVPIYFFATILYLVLLFSFLVVLPKKRVSWGRQEVFFLPIYIISSFSILSSLIDGGPMTKEFLLSLAALVFVFQYDSIRAQTSYRQGLFWFFLIAAAAYVFHEFFGMGSGQKYFALLLFYGLPILTLRFFRKNVHFWVGASLIVWGAFVLTSYVQKGYFLKEDAKFYNLRLFPGEKVLITGYRQNLPMEKVFQHGPVTVYADTIQKPCTLREYAYGRGVDYRSYLSQVVSMKFQKTNHAGSAHDFTSYRGGVRVRTRPKVFLREMLFPFWKVRVVPSTSLGFDYDFLFLSHRNVRHINFYVLYAFLREMLKTGEMVIVLP